MASDLYTVLSGLYSAVSSEKTARQTEVTFLSTAIKDIKTNTKLAGAGVANSGLVYGDGDVSITNGVITVLSAGAVKNALNAFGASFDGSAAKTLSAGSNIDAAVAGDTVTLSAKTAAIAANATELAIAGDVYALAESTSAVLKGEIDDLTTATSAAYGDGEYVVVSKTDGIKKSSVTIGAGDKTDFGSATELATEAAVTGWVFDTVADIAGSITDVDYSGAISGEISGHTLTLSTKVDGTTIDQSTGVLKSVVKLEKAGSAEAGFAATYFLADKDGEPLAGATINIPKDQFLSAAVYNATTESIDLTFATSSDGTTTVESPVSIPVSGLVHEFEGVSGVAIDYNTAGSSQIKAVVKSGDKYLDVDGSGLYTKGIDDAIAAETSGKVAKVNVPVDHVLVADATSGTYKDGGAVVGTDSDSLTSSTAAPASTLATEVAVKTGYKGLVGASSDADLNTWVSGTASEEGSLAKLKADIEAFSTQVFATVISE